MPFIEEHWVKNKENEKRDKFLYPAWELNVKEHKFDRGINCKWQVRNDSQRLAKAARRVGNRNQTSKLYYC